MSSKSIIGAAAAPHRIMAYCHDSVGIGHFHRTLAICERVRRCHPESTFLLATGTPYVPIFNLPAGVDYVKLPSLAKFSNRSYRGKYLTTPVERVLDCRKALLQSTVDSFEPEVILVDKAPAGVCGELLPTLRWIRRHRPQTRVVFGMRDIEDDPETTITQWTTNGAFEALESCYDEVWVYGMREVFDVAEEYRLSSCIREKLRFLGYVVQDECTHQVDQRADRRRVLVTVGGGTDGERLLRIYLEEAGPLASSLGVGSTIVGGPDLPEAARGRLARAAADIPGARWVDYVSCMTCRIRKADVVVTMGGYNTMCEVVSKRKAAVVVPRTKPRLEQAIRARLWSRRAALDVLRPEELSAPTLAERVLSQLDNAPANVKPNLNFNGLDHVSRRFGEFWREESRSAAAVRLQ